MKRAEVTATLLAILLFTAGAVSGVLGDRYYAKRTPVVHTNREERAHYLAEMRSKLHLTNDQVRQLEGIMNITRSEFKAARNANMIKIKQEHVERVRAILTPEQLPIYARLVAEHEQHAMELEKREP